MPSLFDLNVLSNLDSLASGQFVFFKMFEGPQRLKIVIMKLIIDDDVFATH